MKKLRVLVLGAGFGGMELSTILSEALGDRLDLTLIDKSDSFIFGYSKLDVMFRRTETKAIRLPYSNFMKSGVRFRQETITSIDPKARRVSTPNGTYDTDVLVVALGADYDFGATPGLIEGDNEFYTLAGAEAMRTKIPKFNKGRVVVGVVAAPYKCPPGPSEAALMMHDNLVTRGIRDACEISLVIPFPIPIPPSPETSKALIAAFAERSIKLITDRGIKLIDNARNVVVLDNGDELPFDLFMGIPKHYAPAVVRASELAEEGWIPADPKTLKTKFPGVYAIGDVTKIGVAKAGLFAEGAAKVAAAGILADYNRGDQPAPFDGAGTCYIEFGEGKVGRSHVNFLSGPKPFGEYNGATEEFVAEKKLFGATRRARWFGMK
jgi:sulfide:quinone oxidoreductase